MIWSSREIWSRLCHRSLQLRWGCSCHHITSRHVTSHITLHHVTLHHITVHFSCVMLYFVPWMWDLFFLLSFDSFFPQDLQTTAEFPAHMEELRAVLLKVCLECDRFTSSSPLLSSPLLSSQYFIPFSLSLSPSGGWTSCSPPETDSRNGGPFEPHTKLGGASRGCPTDGRHVRTDFMIHSSMWCVVMFTRSYVIDEVAKPKVFARSF